MLKPDTVNTLWSTRNVQVASDQRVAYLLRFHEVMMELEAIDPEKWVGSPRNSSTKPWLGHYHLEANPSICVYCEPSGDEEWGDYDSTCIWHGDFKANTESSYINPDRLRALYKRIHNNPTQQALRGLDPVQSDVQSDSDLYKCSECHKTLAVPADSIMPKPKAHPPCFGVADSAYPQPSRRHDHWLNDHSWVKVVR